MKRNNPFLLILLPLLKSCFVMKQFFILDVFKNHQYQVIVKDDNNNILNIINYYYDNNLYSRNENNNTIFQDQDDFSYLEFLSEDNQIIKERIDKSYSSTYLPFYLIDESKFNNNKIDKESSITIYKQILLSENNDISYSLFNLDHYRRINEISFYQDNDKINTFIFNYDIEYQNSHLSSLSNSDSNFISCLANLSSSYSLEITSSLFDNKYYLYKTDGVIYLHKDNEDKTPSLGDLLYKSIGGMYREYVYDGKEFKINDLIIESEILPNISSLSKELFYNSNDSLCMHEKAYKFGVDNFMLPYFNQYDSKGVDISINTSHDRFIDIIMTFEDNITFNHHYSHYNSSSIPSYVIIPEI